MGEVGLVVGTQVAAQTALAQASRKNTERHRGTVHSSLPIEHTGDAGDC